MPDIFDQIDTGKRRDIFDDIGEEVSDITPPESFKSAGPHYVPAELQQFEEQAAIERNAGNYQVPDWLRAAVPQAMKFPAKVVIAGGAMQTGNLRWPTDEEVETPVFSPGVSRGILAATSGGLSEIARDAGTRFPDSIPAQVASGVTEGVTDAVSSFSTPENLALLPIAPGGKLAQRAIAGVFLGQAISGTPEQWEAFNNATELTDKIRIATSMGLGYALPMLAFTKTGRDVSPKRNPPKRLSDAEYEAFMREVGLHEEAKALESPKVVEPVRTTQEVGRQNSQEEARISQDELESRPPLTDLPQPPPPVTESIPLREQDVPSQSAQKESTSPPVAEARPKIEPAIRIEDISKLPFVHDQTIPFLTRERVVEQLKQRSQFTEQEIQKLTTPEVQRIISNQPETAARRSVSEEETARLQHEQEMRSELSEVNEEAAPSILKWLTDRGGLPTHKGSERQTSGYGGELRTLYEMSRGGAGAKGVFRGNLFSKEASPIDQLTAQARADGFKFETPDDLLNAVDIEMRKNLKTLPVEIVPENVEPIGEARQTSTKNFVTAIERERRDSPQAEQAARRDFGTVWDEAEAIAQTDREAPRRLAQEIAENPRALTDKENALLLRRQIEVQNEHSAAIDAVNAAPEDAAAISRLETARNDLQTVYDATKSAGTETGRGLNARKMLANQDFTLAKMEAETRAVVNDGKPLSPKQANEVRNLHARIAQAEARVAAYEAREQFNAELKQARRTGFRPDTFLEQQAQKARERIIARRGKLFSDPVGVTQIAHLADEAIIGAAHIARGVRNFGDWSKTMLSEFGERIKPYLQALFAKAQSLHSETAKRGVVSPEERLSRALEGDKSRIRTNIAKIEAKTAADDFEPPVKAPPRMDKEKAALLFEYQKAKEAYTKRLFESKLAKQSVPRKALRYGGEVLNTTRALMTSFDLSAVLRQGGFVSLGHPLRAAKSLPAMFRAFASEKAQFRINEEIRNRPNAPLYRQSKLYLADESTPSLSKMEESYMSRWATKIPIVAGSQRAYTTFLNKLRADSFDAMVENLGRRGRVTTQEAQAIANFINVATGRGNMGGAAQAAVSLNTVFFAPRYVVSRFQLLAGQPLYGGTGRTRVAVAKEYGRMLAGLATVYALAKSAGAEVENDPRSSDFGKLRFGDTRVDPLFGLAQSTVLLSRLGSGETKNLKGKILPIRGEKVPYGSGNSADVIARFLRTKLSPSFGGAVDILSGKNVVGEPVTPQSAALKMMVPLSFGDIYNAMKDQGVEKGTAFAMLAMFGMGVQHYSPRVAKPKSERRKTLEEAMAELRQGKIKEFLTGK